MLDRLIAFLTTRPRLAIPIGVLLVVASVFGARRIVLSSDPVEQLPQTSANVVRWIELSRRFGGFDTLIVGLEEPGEGMSSDGLIRLARITGRLGALKASGLLNVLSLSTVETVH